MKNICFYFLLMMSLGACINQTKNTEPIKVLEDFYKGKQIYSEFCASCHMPNGEGVPNVYPPLDQSDYLMTKRKASIQSIKYGLAGEIIVNGSVYNNAMAPLGLTDQEIADVLNYITNSWTNTNKELFTEIEVSKIEP